MTIRAWGMPLPNIGLWTATQAAPKAPQRKRPCRSRALSLILTVRSLNHALASPEQGLVARLHLRADIIRPLLPQMSGLLSLIR
jgi:hypothetical protein